MSKKSVKAEGGRRRCLAQRRRVLRSLLRSYGFADGRAASRLTDVLLRDAAAGSTDHDALLQQAEDRIVDWLSHAAGRTAHEPPLTPGMARTAFLTAGIARRWPSLVLVFDDLPAELKSATQRSLLVPIPPESPCVMIEQSLAPVSLSQAIGRWLAAPMRLPARIPLSGRR